MGEVIRSISPRLRVLTRDMGNTFRRQLCRRYCIVTFHTMTASPAVVMRGNSVPRFPLGFIALGRQQLGIGKTSGIRRCRSCRMAHRGARGLSLGCPILHEGVTSIPNPICWRPNAINPRGLGGQSPPHHTCRRSRPCVLEKCYPCLWSAHSAEVLPRGAGG